MIIWVVLKAELKPTNRITLWVTVESRCWRMLWRATFYCMPYRPLGSVRDISGPRIGTVIILT